MLRTARDEVRKNYYDPTFHGIDLDARFRTFDSGIDNAKNTGDIFTVVAAFLAGFKDSHLFFEPPSRTTKYEPGYEMRIIGDRCFVTNVKPKSSAAAQLHPGDEILSLNGFALARRDMSDAEYYFRLLAPRTVDRLEILTPDGTKRTVDVQEKTKIDRKIVDLSDLLNDADLWNLLRHGEDAEYLERERVFKSNSAVIWKMASFHLERDKLGAIMSDVKKRSALILDLRGNPGGYTSSLQQVLGEFFDHDVKIADRVMRKPGKPEIAKHWTLTGKPFAGKLIVLVDSGSGSSAELFARVVQLEHRGTVIGDHTAGEVMEARNYGEQIGADTAIYYGFSITDANLIMADGKSLEGTGVTPDELILPTPADLAAGRDPVLARATELAGDPITPEAAGRLFPYEWASEY